MWSSALATRLGAASEAPPPLELLLARRLEGVALVGWPGFANPSESEELSGLRASRHLAFQAEFSKMQPKPPVIRASGGRCDVTRRAPPLARDVASSVWGGRRTMKSAVLEKPAATGVLDTDRLRAFLLVRI